MELRLGCCNRACQTCESLMRTIRRLYIYLVTLISLELLVWGLVNLLQNLLSAAPRSTTNLLASGLSLVLVGLPFFLLHGWVAQREARRDPEERSSRLRALFHYAVRLALLSPAVIDLYNLVKEPLRLLLGMQYSLLPYEAVTPLDRLISLVINLVVWALMERLLRADWRALPTGEALTEVRRLSRYVWMLYGLILAVTGVFQILQYLLSPDTLNAQGMPVLLVSGLAFVLVGVPLWVVWWQTLQHTCNLPGERPSTLRRLVLYLLTLVSALVVLLAAASILQEIFQSLLGNTVTFEVFRRRTFNQLALALPFGVLWAFFSRQVFGEWAVESDDLLRMGLRRLYHYPLAAAGNALAFAGAWKVLGALIEMLLGSPTVRGSFPRADLALGLGLLVVGLPYWLANWPRMQTEAARPDETGDHARRSVLRKSYLYLAVFLTVVGLMSATGVLFYRLINAALGNPGTNLLLETWQQVSLVALLAAWLGYHFSVLRVDGRLAQRSLAERQAAFSVLVLQPAAEAFYPAFAEAVQRQVPQMRVTFHPLSEGLPLPVAASVQAVVLPAALALQPDPLVQQWLAGFTGRRVVVPLPAPGWVWAGQASRSAHDLALETAGLLRQLAEGQALRAAAPTNPWVIVGFVLGAIFAAFLIIALFFVMASGF